MKTLLAFLFLLVAVQAPAPTSIQHNHNLCFPKNDIKIPSNTFGILSGMSQARFNEILDHVTRVFEPIVSSRGGVLDLRKMWNKNDVNAQAYRQGNRWVVEIWGGMARHREMTELGLYLITCHELGHHMGGAPLQVRNGNTWASDEGQSDYYAALKCFRELFSSNPQQIDVENNPTIRQSCEENWSTTDEIALCERSASGGLALAKLIYDLDLNSPGRDPGPTIDLNRPHPDVVSRTFHDHPQGQCRLDTSLQASYCSVDFNVPTSISDPNPGTCNRQEGFTVGNRPLCWFKPGGGGDNGGDGEIASAPLLNGGSSLNHSNPQAQFYVSFDVSEFQGAGGAFIEFSRPNTPFSNPNGTEPDRNSLGGASVAGVRNGLNVLPIRSLPGWGTYYIRVISLDRTGNRAVGKFSNSSRLELRPRRGGNWRNR